MTDAALDAALEDDYETELSRLGSSKALYALTGGEMETEAVLDALADRAAAAAATFEVWADEGGPHDGVFDAAAETARDHADRIAETAEDATPSDSPTSLEAALRDLYDPDARLGGLLAWAMITDRTLAQAVGFFVGNADTTAADHFRGLRSDVDDMLETVGDGLAGADEGTAMAGASDVVEATYAGYVETLEGMGVKVKPVC